MIFQLAKLIAFLHGPFKVGSMAGLLGEVLLCYLSLTTCIGWDAWISKNVGWLVVGFEHPNVCFLLFYAIATVFQDWFGQCQDNVSVSAHDAGGLVSQWGSTIKSLQMCSVTNQHPTRYDLRCCQDAKLYQTNKLTDHLFT